MQNYIIFIENIHVGPFVSNIYQKYWFNCLELNLVDLEQTCGSNCNKIENSILVNKDLVDLIVAYIKIVGC